MEEENEFEPSSDITVICGECFHRYTRPTRSNSRIQDYVLDWSVCPKCETPRHPSLHANIPLVGLCRNCGIPNDAVGGRKAARGLCWTCYRDKSLR